MASEGESADPVFEWDPRRAASNLKKHGVSFEEARNAFADPLAVIFDDVGHSRDEPREILVGRSDRGRLLVVIFTMRTARIRIISARKANRRERTRHEAETA